MKEDLVSTDTNHHKAGHDQPLVMTALRSFIEEKLAYVERMELNAINGDHHREAARNNGKATALEMVLKRMGELDPSA